MNSVRYISGVGSKLSLISFVGEAPSTIEIETGIPFSGPSGEELNEWLDFLKLSREDIYITNVIKVKLDNNREPTDLEINSWKPILIEELADSATDIIVALGSTAAKTLLEDKFTSMKDCRGKLVEITTNRGCYTVFPIYHPQYVRRFNKHEELYKDLRTLKEYLCQ